MKRAKIVVIYALAGPPIGALLVSLSFIFWEQATLLHYLQFLAMCVVFAYPTGVLAAIGSGIAHAVLHGRASKAMIIGATCVMGVLGHWLTIVLLGNADKPLLSIVDIGRFALPPLAAALILCNLLMRFQPFGMRALAQPPQPPGTGSP